MKDNQQSFTIKHWSEQDRPREKLLQSGSKSLSNAELVAILLGSGSRNESAVALAKKILQSINHKLEKLPQLHIKQLQSFRGIGEAKAVTILATMELAHRIAHAKLPKPIFIKSSADAFAALKPVLHGLPHEEFWVLYVNNSNKIISQTQLSKGGITGTVVDVRIILKQAIELGAVALILAHNHPSGTLIPSASDKNLTTKLVEASKALDIKVLDHLILASNNYFSFADEGLI